MNETLTINTSQAEFYDDSKSPLTWSQLPPAQCGVNQDCLKCEYDVSNDVIFIEGDFYVVAILPVSDKNTDDLLTCGDVKGLAGADIAQSVVFAVEEANKKTGMFSVSRRAETGVRVCVCGYCLIGDNGRLHYSRFCLLKCMLM